MTTIEIRTAPAEGSLVVGEAGSVRVAVANVAGDLYAFADTCTHEACSLAEEGYLDGLAVICGCHGGTFDVRSGEPTDGPAYIALATYRVTRSGDGARVSIDE